MPAANPRRLGRATPSRLRLRTDFDGTCPGVATRRRHRPPGFGQAPGGPGNWRPGEPSEGFRPDREPDDARAPSAFAGGRDGRVPITRRTGGSAPSGVASPMMCVQRARSLVHQRASSVQVVSRSCRFGGAVARRRPRPRFGGCPARARPGCGTEPRLTASPRHGQGTGPGGKWTLKGNKAHGRIGRRVAGNGGAALRTRRRSKASKPPSGPGGASSGAPGNGGIGRREERPG